MTTASPAAAPDVAETEFSASSLRARWFEPQPDGTSRRDAALRLLRDAGSETPSDLRGISLVGEDLQRADLTGCDLSAADLSEADLSHAKLVRATLTDATLYRTKLDGAELLGADLTRAKLSECSAVRAGFGHANLEHAELFQANLSDATLIQSTLHCTDLRAAVLENARLTGADLHNAQLTRARLRSADLCTSDVHGADFSHADLRDSHLRDLQNYRSASWLAVDLRDVNFSGAYILRRWIMDENYLFEFRTQGRLAAFVYRLWWVTSDCGRSLGRWFAWNLVVALLFGFLYTFVAVDYGDYPTALSPYYYSFVTLTTLGYGDVLPASATAQILAVFEVVVGYLGFGGLLSIFAARMGRRAD